MRVNFGFVLEHVTFSPAQIAKIADFHAKHGHKLKAGDEVRVRENFGEGSEEGERPDPTTEITVVTNDEGRLAELTSGGAVAAMVAGD